MSKKEKLPFWMGVVLGMLLGIMLVLVIIVPQIEPAITLADKHPSTPQTSPQQIAAAQQQAPSTTEPSYQTATKAVATPAVATPVVATPVVAAAETPSLMSHQQTATSKTINAAPTTASQATQQPHGIALVLDDVGYDMNALKRLLHLSVPIAISILPDAPYARQAAELTKQAGQVVMLHLPMQPEDPSLHMNEAFLRDNMADQALRDTFLRDLEKVPYVQGVNNHMGSKLTQLNIPMQSVMQICREKGFFFIDSRTSAYSVAAKVAEKTGIASASRSIFLDHEMTLDAMKLAWQRARTCIEKKIACIVIAHPRAKTLTFLENYITKEDAAHIVSVTTLLNTPPSLAQVSKPAL